MKRASQKITIAVVNAVNKTKKITMNKDLNGGFGTADDYIDSPFSKLLSKIKWKSVRLPIISLSFLMGIFKERGIYARYYEGKLPETGYDIILVYGSVVDYRNENFLCRLLKRKYKNSLVGFIGPFPSVKPELFNSGDFVINGDFEYFFLKDFKTKNQLKGIVAVKGKVDMNELPRPEPDGFPINNYIYFPLMGIKPFFSLQSSRGCPYGCAYYCVYGAFQGGKLRVRSPKNVVADILYLKNKYGIKGFQFRDPTFGIPNGYIREFCNELKQQRIKVKWGMETRLDLLDEKKIDMMFETGLRAINTGVETSVPGIAKQNRRVLDNIEHQERILKYCEKKGIKVSAFYILGYEGDTKETIEETLKYAMKLNTFLARFSINTPYPGTEYFDRLEKEGRINNHDYETYSQFNLVFDHKNFSNSELRKILSKAYRRYYLRPSYIFSFLKWKIREFWL